MRRPSLLALLALTALLVAPAQAMAAEPTFGEPTAQLRLGEPLIVRTTINGGDFDSVDAVLHLKGNPTAIVIQADLVQTGIWQAQADIDVASSALCACLADGNSAPNTSFDFHFRAHLADGSLVEGPVGQATVEDQRFEWQTYAQDLVVVHWYAGDEQFAQGAATVANEAIDRASELLGVTLDEPVDLFIYDTEDAMREAVSPNRENVAGEAHPDIRTMFVHVPANQSVATFAGTLIRHELTHLVFHAAIDNDYHGAPRWLDEGVAVYLSEGYNDYWHQFVDPAADAQALIPLHGLRGLFPSTRDEFYLAYGESVAAVDFFIRSYGEQTLWDLVRSYAAGVSDDTAFSQATGADVAAFNRAWFESLGNQPQEPVGPQPGQPGPVPSDWTAEAAPTPAPGGPTASQQPGSPAPGGTPPPSPGDGGGQTRDLTEVFFLVALSVLVAMLGLLGIIYVGRANRQRPPGA